MTERTHPETSGLTRRSWSGILLVWLSVSLPFVVLYAISRRVVLNEIRNHAVGVAIAASAGLGVEDLESVRGPEDAGNGAYRRIQERLARLIQTNPDLRYIYTMRRSSQPFAAPHLFEYVVDQPARDFNGDGKIDEDERSEPPGKPYDARHLPALQRAWDSAGADPDISPDPPYPDLISGYAPVRDGDGKTVAIVGVDVTASTVHHKLVAIRVVIGLVWVVICALITLVIHLYYQQRDAFEQNKRLNEELTARNDMLRKANEELAAFNQEERREWAHQHVSGEPVVEPSSRSIFDTYYLGCAVAGADLVQVFNLDQDHVGFYMAETGEHGVREALVAGLLKLTVVPGREPNSSSSGTVYADLQRPESVMTAVLAMLDKELPPGNRIGFAYGVVDFNESVVRVSVSGLPPPLHHSVGRGVVTEAVAAAPVAAAFPVAVIKVEEGDRLVLRTRAGDGGTVARLGRILTEQNPRTCVDAAAYVQAALLAEVAAADPKSVGTILAIEMR